MSVNLDDFFKFRCENKPIISIHPCLSLTLDSKKGSNTPVVRPKNNTTIIKATENTRFWVTSLGVGPLGPTNKLRLKLEATYLVSRKSKVPFLSEALFGGDDGELHKSPGGKRGIGRVLSYTTWKGSMATWMSQELSKWLVYGL